MNFTEIFALLAQDAATSTTRPPSGFGGSTMIMMLLMIVMFYFVLIRPQRKQQKEQQKMRDALTIGDEVITIGGIHGIVANKTDKTVTVKVSDASKIKFDRSSIASVTRSKGSTETTEATEVEAEVVK